MDVMDAIHHRLEVRSFSDKPLSDETTEALLEAGQAAPSGKNLQHWHFILIAEQSKLDRLAELSTTGEWIAGAQVAIVVLTDPTYYYHDIDAGRAISYMQFAAWSHGVGSCIYTGFNEDGMREFLGVPDELAISAVIGFGYPDEPARGRKSRASLESIVSDGEYRGPAEID